MFPKEEGDFGCSQFSEVISAIQNGAMGATNTTL